MISLRQRMIEDMQIRNLRCTRKNVTSYKCRCSRATSANHRNCWDPNRFVLTRST